MISNVNVDRESNVVRFYVRKPPAVTPEPEEMPQ